MRAGPRGALDATRGRHRLGFGRVSIDITLAADGSDGRLLVLGGLALVASSAAALGYRVPRRQAYKTGQSMRKVLLVLEP